MTDNFFADVFYQLGESPSFCYRSGNMVYEELLTGGVLMSAGWNGAGYPLNVLTNCPTRLDKRDFTETSAFNVELDGQSVDYALEFADFITEKSEAGVKSTLILSSKIKPVRIKIHTLLDGTQMFTRYIEIENLSDKPMNLSRLSLISGGMETMDRDKLCTGLSVDEYYSVGYFDDDRWAREGEFKWHPLHRETTSVDTRFNRDRFRHPLFFIRNNVMGKIWFAQIGWSAGCRFTTDYNAHEGKSDTNLAFKAEITAHNPMFVINAGESFVSPELHIGHICGDLDDAVNQMHSHIRKSVLNDPLIDSSNDLIGCGMGAEHDMSVETSKKFIDQFKAMGGEMFIVDAGWECPPHREMEWGDFNGINVPDADRYPDGITEIADYCHGQGMKFGLWVEIESLGKYSDAYTERPEWRCSNIYGEKAERFIDFTNPDAAQWAENELARIIEEYRIDLLRVDYNTSYRDYFNMRNRSGVNECLSVAHFNAVNKMYMRIKKRFPNVIFENCAGGGGRCDLGLMKAFHHTWVSDCQCAPYSVTITNGMTMALPPERVDRLFAGMNCHSFGSFDLQMRNTMLTHMSLNVIAPAKAQINAQQMEFVRHSVDVYKSFIRPILGTSKIYHHTPECDNNTCIIELATPEKDRGVVGVFALNGASEAEICVKPKGADISKQYKVTLDNDRCSFVISGRELKQNGINICLSSSLSSELVLFEAQ